MPAADARAHTAVHRALQRGTLVRPKVCEECGQPPNGKGVIQAHHADYSKPLDVEWLCAKCHRRRPTGEQGRGGMITFRWHEEFVAKIDAARGALSRTEFVRDLIERGLDGPPPRSAPGTSARGRQPKVAHAKPTAPVPIAPPLRGRPREVDPAAMARQAKLNAAKET